jgi:hypothetical protein
VNFCSSVFWEVTKKKKAPRCRGARSLDQPRQCGDYRSKRWMEGPSKTDDVWTLILPLVDLECSTIIEPTANQQPLIVFPDETAQHNVSSEADPR